MKVQLFGSYTRLDDLEHISPLCRLMQRLKLIGRLDMPQAISVEDDMTDDSSVLKASSNTVKRYQLSSGDAVIVGASSGKVTLLMIVVQDELPDGLAHMNYIARLNLGVSPGDLVTLSLCPNLAYIKRVDIAPVSDEIWALSRSLFHDFIIPHFRDAYRPLRQGDLFKCGDPNKVIVFEAIRIEPLKYGIVGQDTCIRLCFTEHARWDSIDENQGKKI